MSVPGAHEEGYATAIEEETRTNSYVTVLATSDAALLALGAPVRHLVDKTELHANAERADFDVPPGVVCSSRDDLLARAGDFDYPIVLKPRVSTDDRKAVRIEGPADLETVAVGDGPVVVQPWLEGAVRGLGGVTWRGRLFAAVHQRVLRTWPAVCGGASAATIIDSDREL